MWSTADRSCAQGGEYHLSTHSSPQQTPTERQRMTWSAFPQGSGGGAIEQQL